MKGKTIDINVDIGEGFLFDEALLQFASSANICCGVHAGSEQLTREAIDLCVAKGIRIGAHPGYPDRANMGRQGISIVTEKAFLDSIFHQVALFRRWIVPSYIKPHGGFYSDTAKILPDDWQTCQRKQPLASSYENGGLYLALYPGLQALSMLLRVHHVPLMGLDATAHRVLAQRAGQTLFREGFADRGYRADGTLIPRGCAGALLSEPLEIRRQLQRIGPFIDSVCIHGDSPDCVKVAETVYGSLIDLGFEIGCGS